MIPLLRKELRALAPIGVLGMLLMSGDVFYRPLLERHDEASWTHISDYVQPGKGSSLALVLLVLATSAAYGAYPREHDEGTIHLLHALPLRRRTIFAAKVTAGWLALLAAVLALFVTDGLQSSLSSQSISGGQWQAGLALRLALLQATYCVIVYGHALLASVLRLFGLIPYALLLVLIGLVEELYAPAAWIDPGELLVTRYHGRALVMPWGALAAHLTVATLAYGAAYLAWAGPAEQARRTLERLRQSVAAKVALGCGGAAFVGLLALVALGLLIGGGLPSDDAADDEVVSFETVERQTERYVFSYPAGLAARAEPLMEVADGLHEALRVRLGAEAGPMLLADLSDTSREHLGIAAWTHVRVGLVAERDPVRLRRTFAHETAHAFQHWMSDGRQGQHASAARFFAEGSAEHLSFVLVPGEEELARSRRIAAATWTRHRMRFEDLADDRRLRERFDPLLVYPLGELWTEALTLTHGEGAVGEVLRTLGRGETRRGLAPRALWADTLRRAGFDLEAVDAAFAREVAALVERDREAIEAIPRLGGGVTESEGASVGVTAVLDREPPPAARFVVRLRAGPESGDTEVLSVVGAPSAEDPRRVLFRIHRALLPAARFQLLFSVQLDEQGWPFSETWQWATR